MNVAICVRVRKTEERVSETGDGEKFDAILVQPQGH